MRKIIAFTIALIILAGFLSAASSRVANETSYTSTRTIGGGMRRTGRYSTITGNTTGNFTWSYKTSNRSFESIAVGSNGTLYVGTDEGTLWKSKGRVFAIDKEGNVKWSFNTGEISGPSITVGSDGTIYVSAGGFYQDKGRLYALEPNGTLIWKKKLGRLAESAPAIGKDGTIYVGSLDGYFYAIDQQGNIKWKYETENGVESSPAIGEDGTIYFGTGLIMQNGCFYAMRPDGTLKWRYNVTRKVDSNPLIGDDGTIYFSAAEHNFYALNKFGEKKWNHTIDPGCYSPAIDHEGNIYISSWKDKFYSINPDGEIRWELNISDPKTPVVDGENKIYVSSNDMFSKDEIVCLHSNGTILWNKSVEGDVTAYSPVITEDGGVIYGMDQGRIMAERPISKDNVNKGSDNGEDSLDFIGLPITLLLIIISAIVTYKPGIEKIKEYSS